MLRVVERYNTIIPLILIIRAKYLLICGFEDYDIQNNNSNYRTNFRSLNLKECFLTVFNH